MTKTCAVLVAAGASSRMGAGVPKILLPLCGKAVIRRTMEAFERAAAIDSFVVVCREEDIKTVKDHGMGLQKLKAVVPGGTDRQQSVANGVLAAGECDFLAIHDGARPLITPEKIDEACKAGVLYGAATLAVKVKDTIKLADEAGFVASTPNRDSLWQIQTPQVFARALYLNALKQAAGKGFSFTDDCQLVEHIGQGVFLQEGDYTNLKLTTPEDILSAEAIINGGKQTMRIGHGYDVHQLTKGRALVVGGVTIPHEKGLLGHSDADVLLHAIADAILGAAGLGDIGGMFPDTDPQYKGADSLKLLNLVVQAAREKGLSVGNIDCTVVAQAPKLKLYLPEMAEKIAAACDVEASCINVKATTEEHLGFTGRKEGISAHAVCLLEQKQKG